MKNLFLDLTLGTYLIAWIGFVFYFKTLEKKALRISQGVLLIGFFFHLCLLLLISTDFLETPLFTFKEVLTLFTFLQVALYFYFSLGKEKAYTLGTFYLPFPILFLTGTLFLTQEAPPSPFLPFIKSFWFPLHGLSSLLSHAFLLAGFISSCMYLLQERELKQKHFGYFFRKLPPLSSLERISEKALYHGFLFLTLGMISGALWSELAFGTYWRWSAKEMITLALWLIYAGMIHQRVLIGWRGKRLAYMFLLGTLLWFFTFFVVNFYFKGFHTYGSTH